MTSIFAGARGLRTRFEELTFGALAGANSVSTALSLSNAVKSHIVFIENGLDTTAVIYVVHPDADPAVPANRQILMKLSAGKSLTFDADTFLEFDAGTKMFVSFEGSAPTSGNFRMLHWG